MPEPGDIKNLARYKQLFSYSGLKRRRGITPTDIDGIIDYNGNAFIILEAKLEGAQIERGQKLALENIVRRLHQGGSPVCCLIFRHNSKPDEVIKVHECIVSDVYYQGRWEEIIKEKNTTLRMIQFYEEKWENQHITL